MGNIISRPQNDVNADSLQTNNQFNLLLQNNTIGSTTNLLETQGNISQQHVRIQPDHAQHIQLRHFHNCVQPSKHNWWRHGRDASKLLKTTLQSLQMDLTIVTGVFVGGLDHAEHKDTHEDHGERSVDRQAGVVVGVGRG
jgi:hypothetical protein